MSNQEPDRPQSYFKKSAIFLKHPLSAIVLTFIFTVILAGFFNKLLDSYTKDRELRLNLARQANESVKSIADLMFERRFRANMVKSSILRNAPTEELMERKKSYDEVFVRYSSNIQSNLFRVREIFNSSIYTKFDGLLENTVRDLFNAQDECITSAYDLAVSQDAAKKSRAIGTLDTCNVSTKKNEGIYKYTTIYNILGNCAYSYADSIYQVVQKNSKDEKLDFDPAKAIHKECTLPDPDGFAPP